MKILGIESSCDDTSVAVVECSDNGFVVIAEKTASQIDIHKHYGGVVPEVAARAHAENILPLIQEVMEGQAKPDLIAVTAGPGLITALLVGVEAARTLSYLWNVPLVAVNHIAGHAHSAQLAINKEQLTAALYPALCLIVSGGHTELLLMRDATTFELIGKTRDDAVGECFDKVAKLLGLEYPGGPKISQLAESGNPEAIDFPRPMLDSENYDFSFAGLKTSALYWLRDHTLNAMQVNPISLPAGIFGITPEGPTIQGFCASFEQAIVDTLVSKTLRATQQYQPKSIIVGGGVSANKKLKEALKKSLEEKFPDSLFMIPDSSYSMDNAAMIAVAGYYKAIKKEFTHWRDLEADPNWKVYEKSA